MKKIVILILILGLVGGGIYYIESRQTTDITLTGIVTTDEVIVSSEIQGRLQQLLVKEGELVTNGQLLGVIQPQEHLADVAFFASSAQQVVAQAAQANADLENARLNFEREKSLYESHTDSIQEYDRSRLAFEGAKARYDSLNQQAKAADAQKDKAAVQLGYTRIVAPTNGIVDTRAALEGEVINPGQAIVTLINPDDLWVRADVEETYIDRIHLHDKLMVKLPSGEQRLGEVFFRNIDADYATQRDVSRSKRDIKTFQIRLRCDNHDRSLAVGMTAYVTLPVGNR